MWSPINNVLSQELGWQWLDHIGVERTTLVCYQQTGKLIQKLTDLKLDDKWSFKMVDNLDKIHIFGHFGGISSNPADPKITFDEMNNTLESDNCCDS